MVQALFETIYSIKQNGVPNERIDCQKLALLFIIFAMGSLHSLELPPNDPSGEEYLDLAKRSLAKTDFLTNSTIAGVQTLVRSRVRVSCAYRSNADAHSTSWHTTTCQSMTSRGCSVAYPPVRPRREGMAIRRGHCGASRCAFYKQ